VKGKFFNGFVSDQVFLNDPFQFFRSDVVIPHPFGINYDNRPSLADPKTVALRPVDTFRPLAQIQFLQPGLEVGVKPG